jgi:hypothetical protein
MAHPMLSRGNEVANRTNLLWCMSQELCWFLDAGKKAGSARLTDRRPKSADARSRGRLGGGDTASYGIWLAGLIRRQATKFSYDRFAASHNFNVVARSLLIRRTHLGLPRNFNELRVVKISRFATSALTAGKQSWYCMGRADLCVSGETASISFYITVRSSYLPRR